MSPAEARRLDTVLAERGLARSRSHAAELVRGGRVLVDGRPQAKPSALVRPDQAVAVDDEPGWVSRAALKLLAALDAFAIDVSGLIVLDAGASTGGFTQVLLHRGAERVIAVDVGHGQLSPVVAADPRVAAIEGMNVRFLTGDALEPWTAGRPIDLVVADLSFISLTLVLPALVAAAPDADLVVLVKPQFEVGRDGVRDGIVLDAGRRAAAITGVLSAAGRLGLGAAGLIASPIDGGQGNREYLAHLSPRVGGDQTEWTELANRLAGA